MKRNEKDGNVKGLCVNAFVFVVLVILIFIPTANGIVISTSSGGLTDNISKQVSFAFDDSGFSWYPKFEKSIGLLSPHQTAFSSEYTVEISNLGDNSTFRAGDIFAEQMNLEVLDIPVLEPALESDMEVPLDTLMDLFDWSVGMDVILETPGDNYLNVNDIILAHEFVNPQIVGCVSRG